MTLLEQPTRVHVTLPAPLLGALRSRSPHLSLATAIREVLAEALRAEALVLRLPPGLRSELTAQAIAQGVTLETAILSLLRRALSAESEASPFLLDVQLSTFATVRQILALALDNDLQRVDDYVRSAQEWIRELQAGRKSP